MNKDGSEAARARRKRSTRREVAARHARLLRNLVVGASAEEIAAREGVSVKRARELIAGLLKERAVATPAEFLQLQIRRLDEAMLVAYAAMSGGNLKAANTVVRIVREYDRYYGFFPQAPDPPLALPPPPLALPAPAAAEKVAAGAEDEGEAPSEQNANYCLTAYARCPAAPTFMIWKCVWRNVWIR
jgi:hypothetical protein